MSVNDKNAVDFIKAANRGNYGYAKHVASLYEVFKDRYTDILEDAVDAVEDWEINSSYLGTLAKLRSRLQTIQKRMVKKSLLGAELERLDDALADLSSTLKYTVSSLETIKSKL